MHGGSSYKNSEEKKKSICFVQTPSAFFCEKNLTFSIPSVSTKNSWDNIGKSTSHVAPDVIALYGT